MAHMQRRMQQAVRPYPKSRCCGVHRAPIMRRTALRVVAQRRNAIDEPVAQLLTSIKARLGQAATQAAALACTASLLLSPAAFGEEEVRIIRLPASANPQIYAAQKTLVEAWTIIGESFVDPDFNHHDWSEELKSHMNAAYNSSKPDKAYSEITAMLSDLGDPYTRVVPPEDYANFRVSSDGELQGVGLLIANEPVNNHLLVLAPIKGGPADRAGMMAGDEVLSINGQTTEGWTGEQAAKMLRGKGGTDVHVKFARRSDGIPGVAGRPEPLPTVQFREVNLRRETVSLSPLYYTALRAPEGGPTLGYIRLTSFSQNAADDMARAIHDLEADGASSFILDLRNNPGGLVRSGMDVARLWLDGHPTVFSVSGRAGEIDQEVALDDDGRALTHAPLAVLVNENSASASEILAGALHDNDRALVIGDSNSYGKGRIQSVFELQDGSALFVTVAKYVTPAGTEIDLKGIKPDRTCVPPLSGLGSSGKGGLVSASETAYTAGLPVGIEAANALAEQLAADKCVLTAQAVLSAAQPVNGASPLATVAKGGLARLPVDRVLARH